MVMGEKAFIYNDIQEGVIVRRETIDNRNRYCRLHRAQTVRSKLWRSMCSVSLSLKLGEDKQSLVSLGAG